MALLPLCGFVAASGATARACSADGAPGACYASEPVANSPADSAATTDGPACGADLFDESLPPSATSLPPVDGPNRLAPPAPLLLPAPMAARGGGSGFLRFDLNESAGILMQAPRVIHEGQLLVLQVYAATCQERMTVGWQNVAVRAYPVGFGWQHALLPVSVNIRSGPHTLQVACAKQKASFTVTVTPGTFPESRLTVDPKFTSGPPPPRVAAERAQIEAALSRSAPTRLWSAGFRAPVAGLETSPFGVRRTYNGQLKGRHLGEDFDGKVGEALLAANEGVVALAAVDHFYVGNAVFIDHGERLFTMYFHMSQLEVKTGDHVSRGQLLGRVGGTGRVTGPHVHFGVKLAGTYINPQDLLTYDPETLPAEDRLPPASDRQCEEIPAPATSHW